MHKQGWQDTPVASLEPADDSGVVMRLRLASFGQQNETKRGSNDEGHSQGRGYREDVRKSQRPKEGPSEAVEEENRLEHEYDDDRGVD